MMLGPLIAGLFASATAALFARATGLDQGRNFYPVVMIVIAFYYVLFAIMGGGAALFLELAGALVFTAWAVVGFRTSLWFVVAALASHGIFDAFHAALIRNVGVPPWWRDWCLAYDVGAAACLAALILGGKVSARATPPA